LVMAADRVIRWTTAVAVIGVAAVAAVASYEHAYDLVRAHGEAGWTARLVPLTVDGLIYASSMLDSVRRKVPVRPLARWLLGLGVAAMLAANVAHGFGHGPSGAVVAGWPAVALVGSYELLMVIIRSAQAPAGPAAGQGTSGAPGNGPLQAQAAEAFVGEVAAGRVPSVRAIRARLHVGPTQAPVHEPVQGLMISYWPSVSTASAKSPSWSAVCGLNVSSGGFRVRWMAGSSGQLGPGCHDMADLPDDLVAPVC
jgi:hypothetical protein